MAQTEPTILDRIVALKREDLERRKEKEPLELLRARINELSSEWSRGDQWSLKEAILTGPRGPIKGGARIQLIAEIKKASPSRGRLVPVLEHRAIARTYTIGGAAAISVLTEERHFQGHIQHLLDVRVSMDGYYPGGRPSILRKDFIFDPYQVWESRAYGADAILLIVAILDDAQLRDLMALARELSMDCLVETHDQAEVERALAADAEIIGINNRNLRTLAVDLATTERLRPLIPMDRVVVAESGIQGRAEAERMAAAGVHAVLVGEALMLSNDVRNKIREFLV